MSKPILSNGGTERSGRASRWSGSLAALEWSGVGLSRRNWMKAESGLNWLSQAPKATDVLLQNLEDQARRNDYRNWRILRRLAGGRGEAKSPSFSRGKKLRQNGLACGYKRATFRL
jgi:hypothetical protein